MSAFIDAHPQPIVSLSFSGEGRSSAATFLHAFAVARRWRDLARQRRQLAGLEPHHLADIGISAEDARVETRKPFWVD